VSEECALLGGADLDLDRGVPHAAHDDISYPILSPRSGSRRAVARFVLAVAVGAVMGLAFVTGLRLLARGASQPHLARPVVAGVVERARPLRRRAKVGGPEGRRPTGSRRAPSHPAQTGHGSLAAARGSRLVRTLVQYQPRLPLADVEFGFER
jgi:hypothetical protein